MRRLIIFALLTCMIVVFLAACGSSEFQKTFDEFKELYISANDFTDGMTGKIDDIIRAIDVDEYENSFNTLKANLDLMESIASTIGRDIIVVLLAPILRTWNSYCMLARTSTA